MKQARIALAGLAFACCGSSVTGWGLGAGTSSCPGGSQSPVTIMASQATLSEVSRWVNTGTYFPKSNSESRLIVSSAATSVTVNWFNDISGATINDEISVFYTPVGGVRTSAGQVPPPLDGGLNVSNAFTGTMTFPEGIKTIEFVNGSDNTGQSGQPQGLWIGTQMISAVFPNCTVSAPVRPGSTVLVAMGTSIEVGFFSAPNSQFGGLISARDGTNGVNKYPGSVFIDAYGAGALFDDFANASGTNGVSSLVTQWQANVGTVITDIFMNGGTNDWAHDPWSASSYQTALIANLPALHTAWPSAHIWIGGPIQRANETTPNTHGSTLADYRTADIAIAAALSGYVSYFPMLPCIPFNSTYYNADFVHLTPLGQATLGACIMTGMGR